MKILLLIMVTVPIFLACEMGPIDRNTTAVSEESEANSASTASTFDDADAPQQLIVLPFDPCIEKANGKHPCEERKVSRYDPFSSPQRGARHSDGGEPSVERVLEEGLRLAGVSPVHLAVRGTVSADAVRCEWRGIARTLDQREGAIRFWLGLGTGDAVPEAPIIEALFIGTLSTLDGEFTETAKSNFLAIARGGLSEEYLFLACHADYTVQEYLLGDGPTSLTVAYDRMGEAHSYELYKEEHGAGQFGNETLMSEGEYQSQLDSILVEAESSLAKMVGGRESVVMLAPMGAHNAIAIEAWQAVAQWDLQKDKNDVVYAMRYGAPEGDPEYRQTLANLESRITAATTPPPSQGSSANSGTPTPSPTRIPNASGLTQYYRNIGAYGDITPDDGSTETFTPDQPPAVYTCANGTAVSSPNDNRGLVYDCEALLESKDTLRGTVTLDWAATSVITGWEGITTGGTPSRVTKLLLPSERLSGTIPASLGRLFELTHLNLSSNSLTGNIPRELGWLHNLEELRLSGNSLTGCIPLSLKDVATNDLSMLNLLYCQPPAPGSLMAGTATETSIPLSWSAVSNTSKYRVEYRLRSESDWTVDSDAITGTTQTVDDLTCDSIYQFRVSAYGSGTVYAGAWSDGSLLSKTTTECMSPVFDKAEYTFELAEDASVGDEAVAVSATHPDDATITYTITNGNTGNAFSIGSRSGAITVAAALDFETTPSYMLTVQAEDDDGDTDSVTVTITVTNVAEDPPPAPENPNVSLANDTFTVSWNSVADTDQYRVQYRSGGAEGEWTNLGTTASTSQTFSPEGGPACGTTYEFRVQARGDGEEYLVQWGTESEIASLTTDACNQAPTYGSSTYSFSVSEDAATGTAVGTVSAADPDNDTLTYGITAGNEDGKFSIDSSGAVSVASALDFESASSYTLTVEAADPDSLSDTATVSITVTDVNEAPSFRAEEYTLTIAENAAVSAAAATFSATDPDAEDTLIYSITAGDDDQKFRIDGVGTLFVAKALDHESTESYSLTLQVSDSGSLSDTATLTIAVMDVNEAPSFDATAYTFTVPENAAQGEVLGNVSATDPDADDTLAYSIAGEKFTVGSGGSVTVAQLLDYETAASYSLTATVADGNGLSDTVTVSITVTDVDETPAFDSEEYSFTVSEDAAVGTVVGTLTASDANERQGQTLAYSVQGDAAFSIDAGTGALRVASVLDYETFLNHELTATVTDETGLTDSAAVKITVRDVAEVTPPVPRGLTADLRIRANRFDLSWNAINGADQYRIQYRIGGSAGKWTNLESTTSTSQTFSPEGGIRCSTPHQFKVQAHGDGETHPARWGSRSHSVAAAVRGCIVPHAPTGLTATIENGTVVLSWTAPAGSEITAHQILRRRPTTEQELLVLVENTGNTSTTYTDSAVEAGVHYIYRVKAINNTVSGPNSNNAQVRIPR